MIFSAVYLLARGLLGCLTMLGRREASKDAELLVLLPGSQFTCSRRGSPPVIA